MSREMSSVRWHLVTGKGGVGKTTVAAALASKLAQGGQGQPRGHRVLLAEIEGRQGLAPLFDAAPFTYVERQIATMDNGGEIYGIAVDPQAALLEYLELYYRLGRAGRALRRIGAIDFATTITPGIRDVLVIGKIKEAVTRKHDGEYVYDALVLDAPPTGRVGRVLAASGEVAKLVRVGPIKRHSDAVMALLTSEQTAVHLVTTLAEMSIQETMEAVPQLQELRIAVGAIIVNQVADVAIPPGRITAAEISKGLGIAQLPQDSQTASSLAALARRHRAEQQAEAGRRAQLASLGQRLVELPSLATDIDAASLDESLHVLTEALPCSM